ncbi:MAG TPA: nicotinate-nucleotide adenylyltransferase [Pyrinomonadaceae bacterium]|jgi:nicotinate-nucleotide adenylyltransferase|nr:nicotinate-nucleotide adenylyltransferase [Pyrinomonadaceae bacterium]
MGGRRRIALYGGTFDPVHVGHAAVARGLAELFALDEVLFIPAYVAPHKRDRRVSPSLHRHAMLALATQGEPRFRVSAVELEAPERPYTIETLTRFQEAWGESVRLFFVMGADSWEEITTWREWERVLTACDQLVVTRPGYELEAGHVTEEIRGRIVDARGASREAVEAELMKAGGPRIYLTDVARVDLSATDVREAAAGGAAGALEGLVVPAVAEYISKYGLYLEGNGNEFSDAGIKKEH